MNIKEIIDKNGNKIKAHTHIGVYGLVIKDDKILLIKKVTGPYDGLLDLPGGSFEFGETPKETLARELQEEVGIKPINYGTVKENIEIDEQNDDSLGASFYNIKNLKKENLSLITILELEKLGYKIK